MRRRRGRAAAKQRLEHIARSDPSGWGNPGLRDVFEDRALVLLSREDARFAQCGAPWDVRDRTRQRLASMPPNRADSMLPWLWREMKRGERLKQARLYGELVW